MEKVSKNLSVIRNWGFYIGFLSRIIIILISIWVFLNPDNPYVVENGLVTRQIAFIAFSFIFPLLVIHRHIPWRYFPFKADALILTPLLFDTVGNYASTFILSYDRFDFADKLAHLWGAGVFTFLAFLVLSSFLSSRKKSIEAMYLFWACLGVGIALEGLWEMWEYYFDFTHGTLLVGGVGDTIGDVAASFIGSTLSAGLCATWYLRAHEEARKTHLSTFNQMFFNKR